MLPCLAMGFPLTSTVQLPVIIGLQVGCFPPLADLCGETKSVTLAAGLPFMITSQDPDIITPNIPAQSFRALAAPGMVILLWSLTHSAHACAGVCDTW